MGSDERERERFEEAAVAKTIVSVGPRQQQSAARLISAGWIGYGEDAIELIARPKRPANGGRRFGEIAREEVPA